MRRLERGASYVPLIIVIVLLIVAVVWAWIKTDESDQLRLDLKNMEDQWQDQQKKRIDMQTYLTQRLTPAVGYAIPPGSQDPPPEWGISLDQVNQDKETKIGELRDKFILQVPLNVFTVDDQSGGIQVEETDEHIRIRYVNAGALPSTMTLQELYNIMSGAMGRMLFDLNRLVSDLKNLQTAKAEMEAALNATIQSKDDEIARQRTEYSTLQSSASQRESDLNDQVNTLRDEKRELQARAEEIEETARAQLSEIRNELLASKQDVVKLKQRKAEETLPLGPDGKVIGVTDGQDLVIIDKGKNKRMQTGLRFLVYDYGKGAVKREKGYVEVIEVNDYSAKARVVTLLNPMFPIVAGDMFESAIYNPDATMHFYLLGNFRVYGRSDARRRLTQLGAVVDDAVTIDTDYLVLGAPENEDENLRDTEAYRHAQELGITVLTEQQLGQFMLYR